MADLQVYYTAMDDLQYALTDGDFGQKWTLLTWPTKIEKLCEKIEKSLAVDNERYQKEMEAEQALFVNTLESVDATVTTFNNYTDMGQVLTPRSSRNQYFSFIHFLSAF